MNQPRKIKPRLLSEVLFLDKFFDSSTRPVLIYVTFIFLIGAILFRWLEGWSWIDSFYLVIITLTTIGYGDFTPSTPLSKLITIFYGINGVVVLLAFFDIIRRYCTLKVTRNGRYKNNKLTKIKDYSQNAQACARTTESFTLWKTSVRLVKICF